MSEKKYPIGGFAPGNYQRHCSSCGGGFIGDKRAVQCEPCAVADKQKFDALSPAEQKELMARNAEFIREAFKDWGSKTDLVPAIIGHGKPVINHDRVIANREAGMPMEEAIFQDGYSAGVEFERKRKQTGAVWVNATTGLPVDRKRNYIFRKAGNIRSAHVIYLDHVKDISDYMKLPVDNIEWLDESGTATAGREEDWIDINDQLPEEGGRYWCYVQHLTDIGVSYFQWNCDYNPQLCRFSDMTLTKGEQITHWRELPPPPKQKQC